MNNTKTKELVNQIYQDISGFVSYIPEEIKEFNRENISPTYGEILYDSIAEIIKLLDLKKEDVFYDLGSGVGKVVIQFFLNTPIKKAYGIEALKYRHQQATKAYDFIKQQKPELFTNRELIFHNGNIMEYDIEDANVIFMNSLCFGENLLNNIYAKIKNNKFLKYIITNTKISPDLMPKKLQLTIQSSWSDNSNFYIFSAN